jgi:hypothetical protein
MQRQHFDEALIWQLMRFPDEPEAHAFGPTNGLTHAPERPGTPATTRC